MGYWTDRALDVLRRSQQESERLGISGIMPEHLLLGLIRDKDGLAGCVLRDLGMDEQRALDLVKDRQKLERALPVSGIEQIRDLAASEAKRMGDPYIGTEHLLLVLVCQETGGEIDIFQRLHIRPGEVQHRIQGLLPVSEQIHQPDLTHYFELAKTLASRYAALEPVETVALAGSLASGAGSRDSDIDLYVYLHAELPKADRARIVSATTRPEAIDNSFWGPGDEWRDAETDIHVDVIFWSVPWIEDQLDRVLRRYEASLGYSTSIWHTVRRS